MKVDIRVVREIVGHSTLAMTQRYTHEVDVLHDQAADRLATGLWG